MSLFEPPVASSWLALATTIHLGFAALRNHRRVGTAPFSSLALVSLALATAPWVFPAAWGVLGGLGLHVLWFSVCERLAPASPAPASKQIAPLARPVAPRAAAPASVVPRSGGPTAPRPRGFIPTPVLAVINETPDIRTFRLARPEGFDFIAGQFIPVRVKADGADCVRCYSLSSSPSTRGYLEISVKKQGLVSRTLHATLRPGSSLFVRPPAGAFRYPLADDRPVLLLAGGIGITPLRSMLHHAVSEEPTRQVTLLYAAQTERDLAFKDELQTLKRRHPQVQIVLTASRDRASSERR